MNHYSAVIFDLDGTLLNTIEDLTDSVNAALAAYHYPTKTLSQIQSYVGNGIQNLMAKSLKDGRSNPDFEAVFLAFENHYKHNCKNKTKPYDGIIELLRILKEEKKKLAIVSNKTDFAVKELNECYFREFDITAIGEREGIARKPAPDSIYQAMKELDVSAKHTVYVGDSEVDIATAQNAKLPCISVLWGFRKKEELMKYQPQFLAESPKELYHLLNKI